MEGAYKKENGRKTKEAELETRRKKQTKIKTYVVNEIGHKIVQ